jgi:hypothetical protein
MHTRAFAATVLAVGSILATRGHSIAAQVQPFPPGFHTQRIASNGTTLYVRVGGTGPAVERGSAGPPGVGV